MLDEPKSAFASAKIRQKVDTTKKNVKKMRFFCHFGHFLRKSTLFVGKYQEKLVLLHPL
jgi:hypothetical protein